jgi:hypothetical protein
MPYGDFGVWVYPRVREQFLNIQLANAVKKPSFAHARSAVTSGGMMPAKKIVTKPAARTNIKPAAKKPWRSPASNQSTKTAAKKTAATAGSAKTGTFVELIEQYSPHVQAIALRLREIIYEVLPKAEEKVWSKGWRSAFYKDGTDLCGIGPQKAHCNFYLLHGALLPDPDKLLEGTGKGMRHVKIRSLDDIPVAGIKRLLREEKKFAKRGMTAE